MAVELIMPQLGLTMIQGTVTRWIKKEGDPVAKGEPVVEILSDKASFDVEAPADGILLKVVVNEGEVVPIATVIAYIGQAGESVGAAAPAVTSPRPGREAQSSTGGGAQKGTAALEEDRLLISPRARQAARQEGLTGEDLRRIEGSGPGARRTEKDVLNYVKATPLARRVAEAHGVDLAGVQGSDVGGKVTRQDVLRQAGEAAKAGETPAAVLDNPVVKNIPLEGVRRIIAERMSQSATTKPHVTLTTEVDMNETLALRKKINSSVMNGGSISVTDIILKVSALALEKYPEVNATLDGNVIRLLEKVNIGVAVATDRGLVVPAVKEVNRKHLGRISREARDLIMRAREGKLKHDEMSGGTFTVSNLGMYEIDAFTPIINPLESAILGVGRMVPKPVVVGGEIVVRTMMVLSLSFDHRVLDGAPAAAFLQIIKQLLENPLQLITGV